MPVLRFLLSLALTSILGCGLVSSDAEGQYANPSFSCYRGELEAYCERAWPHFAESGMSTHEAEELIEALGWNEEVRGAHLGMPSPDAPPYTYRIRERAWIRKAGPGEYEALVRSNSSCSVQLRRLAVWFEPPRPLAVEVLEVVEAGVPC